MARYKVITPRGCYWEGHFYKRGETVEGDVAHYFVEQGFVEEVKAESKPKSKQAKAKK
jgi:hypothetical protein